MKINKIITIIGAAVVLIFASCADEDLAPIITFDSAGKGAYPRLIEETDKLINLFDIAGSSYTYSVEFIDADNGTLVSEYVLDMTYEDNNPENGDETKTVEFARFTQTDFEDLPDSEFLGLTGITITGPEAIAAAGVSAEDVLAGDEFQFSGRLILQDGSVFSGANSSATIVGAAFRGHFDFTMPAGCPSDLTGTYEVTTTDIWCGADPVTTNVDIVALGAGVYEFSDWSFGTYDGVCYGGGTAPAGGDLTFAEVCAEVSFTGFTDSFGDAWEFESSIEGAEWTIKWSNAYGEAGTSVLIHPSGEWPFTLAE